VTYEDAMQIFIQLSDALRLLLCWGNDSRDGSHVGQSDERIVSAIGVIRFARTRG